MKIVEFIKIEYDTVGEFSLNGLTTTLLYFVLGLLLQNVVCVLKWILMCQSVCVQWWRYGCHCTCYSKLYR
jgi:hypothetical protein